MKRCLAFRQAARWREIDCGVARYALAAQGEAGRWDESAGDEGGEEWMGVQKARKTNERV